MPQSRKLCKCGTILDTKATQCRPCAKARAKKKRDELLANGASKQDAYNYTWRLKNPSSYLLQTAKSRAKSYGFEFDLTIEDIIIPEVCPVLGIPLFIRLSSRGSGKNPNNPSLDRIDSSKGYIKGNVQVISWRANDLKKNGTLEEFKKLVEFLDA
jgi:hypothetical protein